MTTTNEKRTTTTTDYEGTSSSSTRVRARAREALLQISVEALRKEFSEIFNRPMPRFTEAQLVADLEAGTPSIYYRYALAETVNAPQPSWRYTLAIVARLKRQQVPEEDLLWF